MQRVHVFGAADRVQERGPVEARIGAQHAQVAVNAMRVQLEAGQFDALHVERNVRGSRTIGCEPIKRGGLLLI